MGGQELGTFPSMDPTTPYRTHPQDNQELIFTSCRTIFWKANFFFQMFLNFTLPPLIATVQESNKR